MSLVVTVLCSWAGSVFQSRSPAVLSLLFRQCDFLCNLWWRPLIDSFAYFFYFFSFSTLCPLIKNSYSLQGEEALLSARWQTQTQVLNREQGKYYSRPQRPMKIWTLQKSCLKLNICSDAECLFLWLLKRKSKAFARRNYIMFSPLLCS